MRQLRRLVIIRHAKAEAIAASDVERRLAPQGVADANALGMWLAGAGIVPDVAWVSAAVRTRQTWTAMAAAASWLIQPNIDGGLYGTDEDGVLELVRITEPEHHTVVVVGHNPTMATLAQLLDDGTGPASADLAVGTFPTSSVAVFEIDGDWTSLAAMQARAAALHVARA